MRAFVRELGLAEDHAPWLLTEACQSPEQLKHVSIEAMVRLGLPPRAAATIRAAVGAPPPEEYFCSISCELMVDPCFAADGHSCERANITAWLASARHVAAHERGAAAQDGRAEPRVQGADLGVQGPWTVALLS